MGLSSAVKSHILKTLTTAIEGDPKVILFGSYAKGTQHKHSDIDIAIKADGPVNTAQWTQAEELLEESSIPQKIDLIDYHRVKKGFQELIDKEGIPLN